MIFVTVGTHEQPFDRLIREVDRLKAQSVISDEVFIQLGYSRYIPTHCKYQQFLGYPQWEAMVKDAHIVITHGGPGSIMLALHNGKVPIAVPCTRQYGEHVDDHQLQFVKRMEQKGRLLAVYEIEELHEKIVNYDALVHELYPQGSEKITGIQDVSEFARRLDIICKDLLERKEKGDYGHP